MRPRPADATWAQPASSDTGEDPLSPGRERRHRPRVTSRAETEHAAVRLLAGPLLTIGPKRNSEALSRGFRSVAHAAVSIRLPL